MRIYIEIFSLACMCVFVCPGSLVESNYCKNLKCPDDRPFCTPIGCVVQCPANDLINGTTCLKSCNEWFIGENRTCQADCPADHFIEEKTVRNGDIYSTQRHCVTLCDPVSFVFNRTCLPGCPREAQYLDEKNCVKKCPIEKNIIYKLTPDDKYLSCKNACHSNVYEEGVCVKYCKADRFVFNTTCVKMCPDEANLLRFEDGNTICTRHCEHGRVNQNGTCVEYCSKNEFVYNGSCVSRCPYDKPFMHEAYHDTYCASCKSKGLKNIYCVDLCPNDMLVHHLKCVWNCPNGLVVHNRSCISKCPEEQSVAVKRYNALSTYFECSATCEHINECVCPIGTPYLHSGTCHVSCPPESNLIRNYTYSHGCVDKCKSNEVIHDGYCVPSCPYYANFVYNRQCMTDCPNVYIRNPWGLNYNQCVDRCPFNMQYIYKKICLFVCPNDQKYVSNFTCTDTCRTRFVDETSYECLDECKSGKYVYNNTSCVSVCPNDQKYISNFTCTDTCRTRFVDETSYECLDECKSGKYVYNNTICVSVCPNDQKYLSNFTCTDTCRPRFVDETSYECLDECKSGKYIYNTTSCVSVCPNDQKYVHNFTCTGICPTRYTDESSKTCVEECDSVKYIYNDSICVSVCPSAYNYIHNKTCSESDCSTELRYIHISSANVECVDKCPPDTYINNTYQCVHKCLHHQSNCVDTCPEEAPYVEEVGVRGAECKSSCSQNRFNNTCVESCPSSMPYRYGNECLDHCPSITKAVKSDYFSQITDCLDKCDGDKIILNKTCIYAFECKDPNVVFDDECLKACPSGYYFEVGFGCVHKKILVIIILVLSGVILLVTAWDRRNFIDFFVYTNYAVISCREGPFEVDLPNKDEEDENINENFSMDNDTEPLLELDEVCTESRNVEKVVHGECQNPAL